MRMCVGGNDLELNKKIEKCENAKETLKESKKRLEDIFIDTILRKDLGEIPQILDEFDKIEKVLSRLENMVRSEKKDAIKEYSGTTVIQSKDNQCLTRDQIYEQMYDYIKSKSNMEHNLNELMITIIGYRIKQKENPKEYDTFLNQARRVRKRIAKEENEEWSSKRVEGEDNSYPLSYSIQKL